MIAGGGGEGTGTLEPIKSPAKIVALLQYMYNLYDLMHSMLPGNASAGMLEQTGKTNGSLSTVY